MQTPILQESNYKEEMQTIVEPYLVSIGTEFYLERHAGQKIHCMHYVPENPHAVVMLSHGFIENAEKYKEIAYYFAKEGFSVYLPEHCGHGFSYRLTEDESLVHLDSFERYVEDFIFVTKKAKEQKCWLLPTIHQSHRYPRARERRGSRCTDILWEAELRQQLRQEYRKCLRR